MNLGTRVIDNIQLTIKNIHVRYESFHTESFAIGVTLKQCTAKTANEDWNPCFFDRSKPSNKEKPLFKLLQLDSLGVYWKANEKTYIS